MNKKSFFLVFIYSLLLTGCKNDENENQFNIVGNWYVCQYWGTEEKRETNVYESDYGNIKEVELPEKTQIKNWDDSYDYGKNIITFNENNSMSVNITDFSWKKSTSYILDAENKKIICINDNNKIVYNLSIESNIIILSRKYNETYESARIRYDDLTNGDRGIISTKITYNTTLFLKLIRIN